MILLYLISVLYIIPFVTEIQIFLLSLIPGHIGSLILLLIYGTIYLYSDAESTLSIIGVGIINNKLGGLEFVFQCNCMTTFFQMLVYTLNLMIMIIIQISNSCKTIFNQQNDQNIEVNIH